MGEVDQPEDPVDQGEADGAERVDDAEGEAVERGLRDVVEPLGSDQDEDDQGDDAEGGGGWSRYSAVTSTVSTLTNLPPLNSEMS